MFGLGYSQIDGLITSVQLSQNNFLGTGNRVSVEPAAQQLPAALRFSYLNPYFTDDGVSLGYNLCWREFDYSDFNTAQYNSTNACGAGGVRRPAHRERHGLADARHRQQPDHDVPGLDAAVDHRLRQRRRHARRSTPGARELGWARDTRNNYFMPTGGTYQRVGLETTLPGSTVEYYKLNYDFAKYWPLIQSLVMNTALDLGYGDSYGKAQVPPCVDLQPGRGRLTRRSDRLAACRSSRTSTPAVPTRCAASTTTRWARAKSTRRLPNASRWVVR